MWRRRKISFCSVLINIHCLLLITTIVSTTTIVSNSKVDLCASLCRCVNDTGIEKIHCDFISDKEYTLGGDGLTLPERANSINITLGDNSRLELREGLFRNRNNINSLSIQGAKNDFKNSNNRVVLTKRSLVGINGMLPEISFKNLKRVTLHEASLDDAREVILFVESVWRVTVEKEVFGSTLYNATFNDIADLNLYEGFLRTSLHTPGMLSVYISRCHITHLMPIGARSLTELRIENSDVEVIKSKAFNIGEINSLILNNVKIQSIEEDIFREGVTLQSLAVTNCNIDKIESQAINNVGITNFVFENNLVQDIIEKDAIEFTGATVRISHNTIKKMSENWLKVSEASSITVMNNTFGSFNSMTLEGSSNVSCTFYHNKFTTIEPNSFKSITRKCPFRQMIFHENCQCKFREWLSEFFDKSTSLKDIEVESYCRLNNDDVLMRCLNAETVKYEQYYDHICSKTAKRKLKLNCGKVKVDKIATTFVDPKVLSDDFDWMEYIHYVIAVAILILLLPCLCILVSRRKKSSRLRENNYEQTNINFHHTDLMHLSQSEGPPSYEASLRSTKSFSNHDRTIIKKTLETMRQKQPEEKYEIVHNNTHRLLHEHLNEYEKVKIIGDIVQTISDCENPGEDFVAFTDILYKHLAPDTTTTVRTTTASRLHQTPDQLYSEPALPQSTATAVPTAPRNPSKTNSEHIYAEPTMLTQQQTMVPLLLANNYSNPLDSNANGNNNHQHLYSEPVMHEAPVTTSPAMLGSFKPSPSKLVATPYAISQSIDQQQPSTSKNLPDILNQPGPSGEISRITRSPTTNRKIPEYTVPSTSHKVPVRVSQDTIEDWSDESMENSQSSNHSGGSNATVKIDELLE